MAAVSLGPISGAITATAAKVSAKIDTAGASCRLAYSTDSGVASPAYSAAVAADGDGWVQLAATGLTANTTYYYKIEAAGALGATIGTFKTAPVAGTATSFSFLHSSCMGLADDTVFPAMQAEATSFLLHQGDWHYQDVAVNTPSLYRAAMETPLGFTNYAALLRNLPLAYQWSDHDYGANDSDSTNPGKAAVASTYRQIIPSYTLPDSAATYFSFQWGRAYFIVLDTRYYRDPDFNADSAAKTCLGATQKAWLKSEVLNAKAVGAELTVIASEMVFKGSLFTETNLTDHESWLAYSFERAEIADFCKANSLYGVVLVAGDAHMLAFDNGLRADYATGGGFPIPQFQASSMSKDAQQRGDNWSNVYADRGNYGRMDITDDGVGPLKVLWRGYNVTTPGAVKTEKMRYRFTPGWIRTRGNVWVRGQGTR